MREHLGWVTNCPNEQSCPQNWLEYAVSELPLTIDCHVCGQRVGMVKSEEELAAKASPNTVLACPSIPCTGAQPAPRAPASGNGHIPHAATAAPARSPTPAQPKARGWICTLQNGERITIDKESMIIGRSRTCDVVIPSAKVSRQHATLAMVDGELFIEDLGSANGVWLNGEKITRTKVNHGDRYTISDETLLFEER